MIKNITILFSPSGGCTEAIVNAINNANKKIRVQTYSFTSMPIMNALRAAHKRGVDVRAIIDSKQVSTKMDALKASGAIVRYDCKHAISHNKVMILDDLIVVTGSFNFTYAAEKNNAENVVIIKDKDIAALYSHNWMDHYGHSASSLTKKKIKKRH